jgi:hypothetical protein
MATMLERSRVLLFACSQRDSNSRFQQFFPLDRTATGIGVILSLGIPCSSVGTVTRLRPGQPWIRGSIPDRGQQILLFSKTSMLILGPIQPPVRWALKILSPGMKRSGKKPTSSVPSSTDVKYEWNHTFTTQLLSVHAQGQLYRFSVIRLYLDLDWATDSVVNKLHRPHSTMQSVHSNLRTEVIHEYLILFYLLP